MRRFRSDLIDITGEKFNRLVAISPTDKKGRIFWTCLCECGNTKGIRVDSLKSGAIKSCGCLNSEKRMVKSTKKGETHLKIIYHYYKKGAEKRNIFFGINKNIVGEIIKENCFYCGDQPSFETTPYIREKLNGIIICNGIDRVDNAKGYILGNIVSCCPKCNQIKMDLSVYSFLDKIEKIHKRLDIIRGVDNG